jgi:POT family proton-dependent oligopeptide transporter
MSFFLILPRLSIKEGFSPVYLILSLILIAFGDVLILPPILSITTKIAPVAFTSQLMGIYYMSDSIAQVINAQLAPIYVANPFNYFLILACTPLVYALIILIIRNKILKYII